MLLRPAMMSVALCSAIAFSASAQAQGKKKTPAQVSAEAAEEEPGEQGMEEDEDKSSAKVQDKTGSAFGIGLDKSPLGAGKQEEENTGTTSDMLDEAADDILDQSFSQPGVDQDTGHTRDKKSGEAAVAVPEKSKPLPGVELKKKEKSKQAAKERDTVVIKDKEVIVKIQNALIKRGAKITADGVMGQTTVDALKAFQKKNGLKADGNPGPKTLTKLGIIYIAK